MDGDEHVMI